MATAEVAEVREMPTWDQVRQRLNEWAQENGEWASYPLPIENYKLVVEPKHAMHQLNGATLSSPPAERLAEEAGIAELKVRNWWYSWSKHYIVYVVEEEGKIAAAKLPTNYPMERLRFAIGTLGVSASPAWSADAEFKAMGKLSEMVTAHAFKCYLCSGMFLETSKRSGVTYWFRKGRPTLATRGNDEDGVRFLAALCLHPIAYYESTFAGCMTPSDDVIAHLLMCRADEHLFWKKANQHPLWATESGV